MRNSVKALSFVALATAAAGCCRDSDFGFTPEARQAFQRVCADDILEAREAAGAIPPQTNPELAAPLQSIGYDVHCNCLQACTLGPDGEPLDVDQEADLLDQKVLELDPCLIAYKRNLAAGGASPDELQDGNVSAASCAPYLEARVADENYANLAELAVADAKADCFDEE